MKTMNLIQGHQRTNNAFNVFPIRFNTTIQKIIKIGQVVLEIYPFQKLSNLIGLELRPRLTTSTYQSQIIQCIPVMNLYYHTKNYQNRPSSS